MQKWKLVGLAGLFGVAAITGGAVAAKRRREWEDIDASELRSRLHARFEDRSSHSD